MNRQDIILRKVSCDYINGKRSFTQLGLSKELNISLSVINGAVSKLKDINAVRVRQRSFEIITLDRLLLYWATHRNIRKDIVYQTRAGLPVTEIERAMPDGIAFTGYTAYKFLFREVPADYSEVYLYATAGALSQIKKRFAANDKIPNVIALKCDSELEAAINGGRLKESSVCETQIFVDLWNMNQWYAKDFVDALSKRLGI